MTIDIIKCRKALQLLIEGKHSLHVPPEKDDVDVLIADALSELERFQEQEDLRTEPLSDVVQFWVDACAAKDKEIEFLENVYGKALQEIFNKEYSVSSKEDLVNIARIALLHIK